MSTGQYGFWFAPNFAAATNPSTTTGKWLIDPVGKQFADAPVSPAARSELLRWYSGAAQNHSNFTPPQYEGDAISRALDSVTLEEHYIHRFGLTREFIRTFLSPDLGGGSGLGADALSAFTEYAADLLPPREKMAKPCKCFPAATPPSPA
jgi:spermidine dehydrogenase